MSTQVRDIEEIPEYHTPAPDKTAKQEIRFRFDGELYTLKRPKLAIAMQMLHLAEDPEAMSEAMRGRELIGLIGTIINYIKAEPPVAALDDKGKPTGDQNLQGRHRLMQRLNDPDDDLDILALNEPFQELMEKIFNRPTGSRPASGSGPRRASRAGGAATHSRPAAISGT